jgi:alpha-1,3-glucosyltransferase
MHPPPQALLPLAVDAVSRPRAARQFLLLAAAGHQALLPLLYRPEEYPVKLLLATSYFAVALAALCAVHAPQRGSGNGSGQRTVLRLLGGPLGVAYLLGLSGVEVYCAALHPAVGLLRERLPFVPLMLTSSYCALGVIAVWAELAWEWCGAAVGR